MKRAPASLWAVLCLGAALAAALPGCLPGGGAGPPRASAAGPELPARRQALADLLAEHWEYTLRTNPEFATILGDPRYNDQLSDLSQEGIDRHLAATAGFLSRFEALDPTGFPVQDQLSHALMLRDLRLTLEGARFEPWQMSVTQMSGLHLEAAGFLKFLRLERVQDYEDYLARLRQLPRQFEDVTAHLRKGLAAGLVPPRILLEKVAVQAERIATAPPEETPFAQAVAAFPEAIPERERARLRQAYLAVVREAVLPAYARFARFVREEYAPRGRAEPGVWALPDGDERYAFLVRVSTTTAMAPEEIHQLGLSEVARIEKEMLAVARRLGFRDLASLEASLERNPDLRARSREEILSLYRRSIDRMYGRLPALFGRLPRASLEVRAVEAFREKEAAAAEYNQGTPDGARPGLVLVNTSDYGERKRLGFETTAYHEGVPGHHLQIALAQELPDLPPFRQQAGYTAYVEGWALYAERLGREIGAYEDPYSLYGHLTDEMLRAIRLVVDTGVHSQRWTREQMVQFFHDHSAIDEVEVQAETDRYLAWPAQALAYKIGQLRILALRERAQRALAGRFDLRAFHDEVLGSGALPLDLLEARIDAWIAAQGGAPEPSPGRADAPGALRSPGATARSAVESFHAVLLDGMRRSGALGFEGREQRIAESLDQTFDIPAMARDAILRGWKRLSEEDRSRWVVLVRRYWASEFAHQYRSFSGQSFETLGEEPAAGDGVVVHARLHQPGGSDVALDYRLLAVDGVWRVVDFHVAGKGSEVRRLRDLSYAALERRGFEALVAELEQQIEQLQRE